MEHLIARRVICVVISVLLYFTCGYTVLSWAATADSSGLMAAMLDWSEDFIYGEENLPLMIAYCVFMVVGQVYIHNALTGATYVEMLWQIPIAVAIGGLLWPFLGALTGAILLLKLLALILSAFSG